MLAELNLLYRVDAVYTIHPVPSAPPPHKGDSTKKKMKRHVNNGLSEKISAVCFIASTVTIIIRTMAAEWPCLGKLRRRRRLAARDVRFLYYTIIAV